VSIVSQGERAMIGEGEQGGNSLAPFLAGAAVGAAAGVVAGTLLSRHAVHLVAALIGAIDRRLTDDDRDHLRFELLLQ
jgi:hypothetical protein